MVKSATLDLYYFHNIDDNPLRVNISSHNLRLSGGSPCVEVGSNSAVPADTAYLDGDLDVDMKDFALFAQNWLAGK
jgi:hypothetical protein